MQSSNRHVALIALILVNLTLAQAMLPPPMLRAVCGAFADAEEAVGNTAFAAGKAAVDMAMKPIAIVGGLKTAAVGTGLKLGGGAIKFVGEKMAKDGALIEATGAGAKGVGLGVAALGVKPLAESILAAGKQGEGAVQAAQATAEGIVKQVGDTSIQIDASIDSPFIGRHHKGLNVTAGLETAFNQAHLGEQQQQQTVEQQQPQQQVEQQQQQQTSEHTVAKRAAKVDTEVLKSAINLVKEAKMEDCVARAICDLNCNPQGFGQDGKQVFMNMVRLQGSNVMDTNDSKYFHDAASKGRASSGKCDQCTKQYEKCSANSTDLIKMASHLRMD